MKAKFKSLFKNIHITKSQLITVALCYFLCFSLFLGIVVIWGSMSSSPTEQSIVASDEPNNTSDWWIDSGRYSIEWYTSTDKETYGDGSASKPYKISSAEDLAGLSWLVYTKGEAESPLKATDYSGNYIFQGKYFEQTVNINLSEYYWQPIGISYTREGTSKYNYFAGNYNGNNHAVSGIFTPAGTGDEYAYQGLFGYVYSPISSYPVTIQNIGIIDSVIQGYRYVGGIVGYAFAFQVTFKNCYNIGFISGSSSVGGVVGYANHATITNCYNTGAISGSGSDVGGIVGEASSTTITNCYNTGSVSGSGYYVGGVVGEASSTTITNCYNTGSVSGSSQVGGVVGRAYASSTTITNCYNTGDVTSTSTSDSYVGGIVGYASSDATITKCYYGGGVTGKLGNYGTYSRNITSRAKTLSFYVPSSAWDSTYPWDFKTVWVLDSGRNNGYPSFIIDYWIRDSSYYSIEWYTSTDKTTYGDGSASNPYKISSAQDLAGLSWLVYTKGEAESPLKATDYSGNYIFQGKYFIQTEDIDLSAHVWQPIGISYTRDGTSRSNYFAGSYDGSNYTVSGIFTPGWTSNAYYYQGLFGYVYSSSTSYTVTIQNIGIIKSNIQGYQYVGGIMGYADASSGAITITNCYNTGDVTSTSTSDSYVGGIVGYASSNATITNCYNRGAVTGSGDYVGGVVGDAYSTISNCYNTGDVSGPSYVGGVVGHTSSNITNCYNRGAVESVATGDAYNKIYVGGVVGRASSSVTITNCYNTGAITGSGNYAGYYVGGVVGYADASSDAITITNCYNTGSVSGSRYVGGVVGYADASSDAITITNCYNTGDVTSTSTSDSYAGGVVGYADASSDAITITNCYNTGSVSGNRYIGGVVGSTNSTSGSIIIGNCYNTRSIIGSGYCVGGIVGAASSNTTITNCYNIGGVKGSDGYVGGVAGSAASNTVIINCYNTGAVTGAGDYFGGIVGRVYASSGTTATITIRNCYNTGEVVSGNGQYLGGVVGYAYISSGTITIINSYNTGNVTGWEAYVGGVAGYAYCNSGTISITNCYNTGAVESILRSDNSETYVGGVVGRASIYSSGTITITNCYNTGDVTSTSTSYSYAGGVVGRAYASSGDITITNCYNTGAVISPGFYVGGVAGRSGSTTTINCCYNTGNVTGYKYVGGVVGYDDTSYGIQSISNCYNTGTVSGSSSGSSYVGGVVGKVESSVNITKCYYGGGVTGQLGIYGTYLSDIIRRAKTLSWYTKESNWNSTYPWDFKTVWVLDSGRNDGYPSFMIDYWIKDSSYYSIEWYTDAESIEISGVSYEPGTKQNPYEIATAEDLAGLSWLVYTKGEAESPLKATDYSGNYIFQGKYFIQTEDIDLSAHVWQPIGIFYTRDGTSRSNYFAGSYDGGNYTVSGIFTPGWTSNAYYYQGLFGYVSSSSSSYPVTIQNIGIIDSVIQGYRYVGGIAGYADASSGAITITNCYNAGDVTSTAASDYSYVGGIVGSTYGISSSNAVTINDCYSIGSVTGAGDIVGGIVGYAGVNTNLTNCYNLSSISGAIDVGGIAGIANSNTIITNCYNDGAVSGSSDVGGIVGLFSVSGTTECGVFKSANFGDIIVTGNSGCAGGLIGVVRIGSSSDVFKMTNCYANCSINVRGTGVNVGGLVGTLGSDYSNYKNVKIEFCSADLEIMISEGSITSQGAFYSGTRKITVENSYSLLTKGGVVSKTISSVRAQMDDNFGYILNFKEGKPIPLGIFYITDLATKTGIVDRINSL